MKKMKYVLLIVIAMSLLFGTMTVNAADTITINKEKVTVNISDTVELSVEGTDRTPTWTSYNANIARVDKFGKVTAVRKGSTKIRARVGLSSKLCTVTVVDSSIRLNKKNATIYHGGTSVNAVQLKATVKGASKNATWESSDPNVAVVDNKGKVTSVSEGTAVITATANSKSASCPVTVKESSISLNMDSLLVSTKGAGSSIKVTPTITGSKKNVKWTTSDKTIATVSGGKVTGKKTGTATITATANGVSASCNVTVTEGLISINEEKISLYAGGLKADTKQLKTNAAKNDVVTWSSSDTSVATVNEKGLVTPVSAGTAVISVECGGKADTCIVTVQQTATNINEDSIQLKTKGTNKTYTLNKQIVGKTASVKWATSDNKVATVSGGKVTARKAGTATITATANGVSDTVTVNVADYDPTIKLNQQEYALYTVKGNTVTLKATVDGPSRVVTWASSDTSVATVTNKGKVTAVGAGTATISASANGVTAECIVDVTESAVVLDSYAVSLDKGEKETIGYDIIGTSQSVKWATANSKIATVSKGVITAKNYGETDIKVTANGVTSICHVNVTNCKHDYKDAVTLEPTCGTEGIRTFTCTLCGDTYTEAIPATGKHHFAWVTVKDADCITEGIKEYRCSECEYAEKEDIIPALGHDWTDWRTVVAPTEEIAGVSIRNCTRCGFEEKKEIPRLEDGHVHDYSFDTKVVEPDCTNDGGTIHFCVCGDSYTDNVVKALGHDFTEWTVLNEATADKTGLKARTCTRCKFEETDVIPVITHEHDFVAFNTVSPTCTEDGYTEYKCSTCGEIKKDNIITAKGHDYEEKTVDPTCTEDGYTEYKCSTCGEIKKDNIITAKGHDYEEKTIDPTCTKRGYTEHVCKVCGNSYADSYVDALGHEAGEWVVTKEPTCSSVGQRKKYCIRCNEDMDFEWIESGEHDWQWVVTKEPTCTEDGEREYRCSKCGDVYRTAPIAAGHSWGTWRITKNPAAGIHDTADDFGERQRTCDRCGETGKESIVAIDVGGGKKEIFYGVFWDDEARKTLDMVNEIRAEVGAAPLEWNDSLGDFCMIRGVETMKLCSHSRPNGRPLKLLGVWWGENLAGGRYGASGAIAAWKSSSGHYQNMIEPRFTSYYCVCFYSEDSSGQRDYRWIQNFSDIGQSGSTGGGDEDKEKDPVEDPDAPVYTVKYNVEGMNDAKEYKQGKIATILDYLGVLPEGKRFIGWGLAPDDTAPTYQPDDRVEMTASLELYPLFEDDEYVYTVQYSGLYADDPNHYKKGDIVTILPLTKGTHIPDGYEFIGWGLNPYDGAPEYYPGDKIEITESLTFYAVFREIKTDEETLSIKYLWTGYTKDDRHYKVGDIATILSPDIHEYSNMKHGYEFVGWSMDREDQSVVYQPNDRIEVTGNINFYPVFREKKTENEGENETPDTGEGTGGNNTGSTGDNGDNGEGGTTEEEKTYTIKYAVTGISGVIEYKHGDIATILEYTGGVPDNMEFIGWGTDFSDKTPSYQPGDQIEMTSSLRLVPIFVNKETGENGQGEPSGTTEPVSTDEENKEQGTASSEDSKEISEGSEVSNSSEIYEGIE